MNQSKNHWLKNSGFVAAVVVLALVFIRLGFWQLDRAAELKELQKPYVEKPVIALSDVASPSENQESAPG